MEPLQIVLGVHLHQPVGNFSWVLEEAYQQAYRPFLDVLKQFPTIKIVWHCCGFLCDWLENNHPEYMETLGELVQQERVELFTGGMYEPIFSVIPKRDRQVQIRMLSDWIRKRFDFEPAGAWLAERVWEPGLVADMAEAGVGYVVLDDYHFFASGLLQSELDGYYRVAELDASIAVFPISEKMRYLIPWFKNENVLEELRDMQRQGKRLAVMMDDAEKFGSWPRTHRWVYERGWLREFFRNLEENQDVARTVTFKQFLEENSPTGFAALPVASYMEMGQWALQPESALKYERWKKRFDEEGTLPDIQPFFRGGIWRNFLVKYPESNYLHKRMLHLSRAFDTEEKRSLPAYENLLKAQCNDVFWHGVFGGLYFPHLRHEAFRNILEAQKGLDGFSRLNFEKGPKLSFKDLDLDGNQEILVNHRDSFCVIAPGKGGSLLELSLKTISFNLLATLSRWKEKYHLSGAGSDTVLLEDEEAPEERDFSQLVFDRESRHSCREKIYDHPPMVDELLSNQDVSRQSFWTSCFTVTETDDKGRISISASKDEDKLIKEFRFSSYGSELEIDYLYTCHRNLSGWFGIEWTLGFAGGDDPRLFCHPLEKTGKKYGLDLPGSLENANGLTVVNLRENVSVDFSCSEPVCIRFWPIETVSQAIDKMERMYQGLAVCMLFPFRSGCFRGTLRVNIKQGRK